MLRAFLCTGATVNPATVALRRVLEEGNLFETTSGVVESASLESFEIANDYDLFVVNEWPRGLPNNAWSSVHGSILAGAGLLTTGYGTRLSATETIDSDLLPSPTVEPVRIQFLDHRHPITRGFRDFDTTVALPVIDAPVESNAVLASARAEFPRIEDSNALMVGKLGKGRVAHICIGVDAENPKSVALQCDAMRRLILRCAEWACTGNVIDF